MSAVQELFKRIQPVTDEATARTVFAGQEKYALATYFAPVPIDSFFCGVLCMQLYTYFTHYHKDPWWTKAVVIAVATIALGFTAYIWAFNAYIFVENFGFYAPLLETKKLAWAPFLDSLVSMLVQCYMSYRAYRLCGRLIIIPIAVFILTLMSVGATMSVLIIFSGLNTVLDAPLVLVPELIWLSSIMTADAIITGSILYGLIKSKTGWSHTDRTISKLIRMTLESQVPPFIIALTFVIEFVQNPANLLGALLQNIQIKFYAMGLMYSLNARERLSQQAHGEHTGHVFALNTRNGTRIPAEINVNVETETYIQGPYGNTPYIPDGADKKDRDDSMEDLGAKGHVWDSKAKLTGNEFDRA